MICLALGLFPELRQCGAGVCAATLDYLTILIYKIDHTAKIASSKLSFKGLVYKNNWKKKSFNTISQETKILNCKLQPIKFTKIGQSKKKKALTKVTQKNWLNT